MVFWYRKALYSISRCVLIISVLMSPQAPILIISRDHLLMVILGSSAKHMERSLGRKCGGVHHIIYLHISLQVLPRAMVGTVTNSSPFSTFSFLAGPHAWIGKTMSIIEMKAVFG